MEITHDIIIGDSVMGRCYGKMKALNVTSIEDVGIMGKCYGCTNKKGKTFFYYSHDIGTFLFKH